MAIAKAAALTLGFAGAFALGVAIGPHVTGTARTMEAPEPVVAMPAPAPAAEPKAEPVRRTPPRSAAEQSIASVRVSEPDLHERLKPVLNRGTNLSMAADGFRTAQEFAAVAHAARNTQVPFLLLKHRVVEQRKSLADAIRESKPDDADIEAARAMAEARADLAALASE
jgi:hypothetical protein